MIKELKFITNKILIIYIPYLGNTWSSHSWSLSSWKRKFLQIHILWVFSSYFWTSIVVSKFLSSTLSHSLIRDVYFQLQTRSVEFNGGFSRYFCTKLQRSASLPRLFFANHFLFQLLSLLDFSSFFLFLSIYLAFFSFSPQPPYADLQRYHVANIVISGSSASPPIFGPGAIETGKSCHQNFPIRQFLVSRWRVNSH